MKKDAYLNRYASFFIRPHTIRRPEILKQTACLSPPNGKALTAETNTRQIHPCRTSTDFLSGSLFLLSLPLSYLKNYFVILQPEKGN